jgi:hypothetical protein
VSCPSSGTAALPPCLPLGIKDSLKVDMRLLDERSLLDGEFLTEGKLLKGK